MPLLFRTLKVFTETKASLEAPNVRMDNGIEAGSSHSHQKIISSSHVTVTLLFTPIIK